MKGSRGIAKQVDRYGYYYIGTAYKGKNYIFRIHEIIAFIGGLDILGKGKVINHINGNKKDNRICNLEVVTQKENVHHAWKNGLCTPLRGSKQGKAKINEDIVRNIKIDLMNSDLKQVEISKKYNVHPSTVCQIKSGRQWTHVNIG